MANYEKQINHIRIPGTRAIELPWLEETSHAAYMPRELRERIPEIGDPTISIGLGEAAIRNVNTFAGQVLHLQPGQNTQVDMNRLSGFRNADFYSWMEAEKSEGRAFEVLSSFDDPTLTVTNVDPYTAVVEKLEIADAPDYEELLENHNIWTRRDGWDYMTQEYELALGLRALFYMRGDLPDSEIDDTPEHFLGVAVYAPSMNE